MITAEPRYNELTGRVRIAASRASAEEDETVVTQDSDQAWAALVDLDAGSRESQMTARYTEIAALPEDDRRAKLKSMAVAEYSLPDDKLRAFTLARMRTWIAMPKEVAQTIATSYGAVMQEMPANMAMKRVALVQTLVLEFTPEEEAQLRDLAPGAFAGAPSRALGLDRPPEAAIAAPAAKKPFWKFW